MFYENFSESKILTHKYNTETRNSNETTPSDSLAKLEFKFLSEYKNLKDEITNLKDIIIKKSEKKKT